MGVLKTDEADEQTDTDGNTVLQCLRNRIEDRLTNVRQRQKDEDETLCKYSGQCNLPGVAHAQNDGVREVSIESHTC